MKAVQTTLRDLIKGEIQLMVPLYQRSYAWESDQLQRLWTDITLQADVAPASAGAGHFLGSVVLAPAPDLTPTNSQWIVVDGQQRLTTLLLALCALRDHQVAEDPGHRDRVNDLYLINRYEDGERRYKLLPTQVDRQAFTACVDGAGDERVSGRVGAAYQFFRRKLVEIDDPADPHDIQRIERVILSRLDLVQITVEKEDNVFRIFESINNTGMRLSQVDLIRNYIFMCLPTRGGEVYERYWLPIQRLLDAKGLDQLMYLVLVLARGDEAQYNDVYRGHQELLAGMGQDEQKIEEYVRELARRARRLDQILRPDTGTEIGARIAFLSDFKATTAYPVIMRLLEMREQGDATDEEVARALLYIESFVVRRLVGRVTSANLNRVFQRLTGRLTADRPVDEAVRAELSPARLYWSSDEEFRRDIAEKSFYWQGTRAQQKLILCRLEESHPFKERADLTGKHITIEHVLPQTLTEEWLRELGTESENPKLLHSELVHTLGNLTLSGYNSELGNIPFKEKKEFLQHSGIAMNHRIAAEDRWGKAQILARAQELADRAITIWPGPLTADRGAAPSRDWTQLVQALAALPPATWTSYGDLAELTGSHTVPVRVYLEKERVLNSHRVLTLDGEPPSGGIAVSRSRLRQQMLEVLQADGVEIDELGRAVQSQRITARELATLLGLPGADSLRELEMVPGEHRQIEDAQRRFFEQLGEATGPQVSGAVQRLLDHWRAGEGTIQYGANGASCAPVIKRGSEVLTPIRVYSAYPGKVEIPFGTLKKRRPFDDIALREELRDKVNDAPGVEIPLAKLDLYPSFPVALLAVDAVWDVVQSCLDWFRAVVTRQE
ncbi:DUF262 domain-containing protein [Planomonospora corallina]|uniref:DUF262 domain-containing protein n=1 Tax=Planomonospora corallina TaxID=1806052 RepID=A0ABV8I8Y3_9ACTN